ncbi:MAG: hypothetical protein IPF82_17025 [Blastocatellia bacterium]|nr:hypothetical protein [Blastocatellia bacterium]
MTVGSESPLYPGSLLVVNPLKGKVVHVIPLGGDASRLTLADTDRTAYVVVDQVIVKRVDLGARQVVSEFTPLLQDVDEPIRPSALAVMPGHPDTVAVSFEYSEHTGDAGTAIYDNGVRRPSSIARYVQADDFCRGRPLDERGVSGWWPCDTSIVRGPARRTG